MKSKGQRESEVAQSYPALCDPMDSSLSGSSIHGIFQAYMCWSGLLFPSPGDLPKPGIEPRSPALQADVLPSEPPGKPWKHTKGLTKVKEEWGLWKDQKVGRF